MANHHAVERITKLEATRRQLRTAIRLFTQGGDPVSVHTLTAAAHEVLRDLLQARGEGSLIKDNPRIEPSFRDQFARLVNEAENFFKLADRDAGPILEFDPRQTHHLLLDALFM
jgi:hypothetical protein